MEGLFCSSLLRYLRQANKDDDHGMSDDIFMSAAEVQRVWPSGWNAEQLTTKDVSLFRLIYVAYGEAT